MATHIYTGAWINWTEGPIRGATITLTARDGNLLISFIATFVTIVGAQLWRILSYIFHQVRSSKQPEDGLHYQQQNILRNANGPASAAWLFLQQAWYWRGRAPHLFLRTLPWALFGFLYIALFAVLATFSSEVSRAAGRARSLQRGDCGYWQTDGLGTDTSLRAYNQKMANESIVSSTYARACYGGNAPAGQCETFPVSSLKWTAQDNASCPFDPEICVEGTAAYKMTTELLDSHTHLGINSAKKDRVQVQKQTTCSPLIQARDPRNGSTGVPGMGDDGDILLEYYYGSVGAGENLVTNYSWKYNTHAYLESFGWQTWSLSSLAPHDPGTGWNPVSQLAQNTSDTSIVFVAANSVRYLEACDDPVFGARYQDEFIAPKFATDEYVVAVACSETYRACNPRNDRCTGFVGSQQLINETHKLDMDLIQSGPVMRFAMASMLTNVHTQVFTRMGSSLRASETVATLTQLPLPDNQWQIEVSSWFSTGLARLQHEMQAYVTGPTNVVPGSFIWQPGDAASLAMCDSQLVSDDGTTTSFSVLGLIITFVIGGAIILTSLILETIVGWFQSLLKTGEYRKLNWVLDDKLQLQRMLLEGVGHGQWKGALTFPVTTSKEKFGGWGDIDIDHPTLIPRSGALRSPWMSTSDVMPNSDGSKPTDVFVKEMPPSQSP